MIMKRLIMESSITSYVKKVIMRVMIYKMNMDKSVGRKRNPRKK